MEIFAFSTTDWQAIFLSFKVAITATIIALPFAIATAWLLVFTNFKGKSILNGIINLPLVLPPVVIGYLLLLLFGRNSIVGEFFSFFGIKILFTWKAAVLASMVIGFPLIVRSIRLGMEEIDPQLIQVARSLGAKRFDAFLTIIIPLSLRSIIAGSTLMFARSIGEFGATIMIAGNIAGLTQTIPLAIFEYAGTPGGDTIALGLCLVSITLALAVLIYNERLINHWHKERVR